MTQAQHDSQSTHAYDPIASADSAAGRFVWHDLMTTDVPRAVEYYTRLLGWTTHDVQMGPAGAYTMIRAGKTDIGGVMPLDPGLGVPSHWIGYVRVDDVDAACERAAALGGRVCVGATDIPKVGRFAVLSDPTGAVLSPFRSLSPGGSSPEPAGPPAAGTFCWDELLTSEPRAVAEFYARVFDWRHHATDMGAMGAYWLFSHGEVDVAGMMTLPAGGEARPFWMPYVAVEDIEGVARRATELGAKIFVPPTEIPGIGRFSVTEDPTGATIAFLEPARPAGGA